MSRLQSIFEQAERENRAALVVYLCAGDPSLEHTFKLVETISNAGADVIEIGMPFSDPTADGPTIQRASERALKNGATLQRVLDMVAKLKMTSKTGIVLFGYYNPIVCFGEHAFVQKAKAVGIDGVLTVDLPPDHAEGFLEKLNAAAIDFVPLLAPTSTNNRIEVASAVAGSFVYYVSMTGVTGAETNLDRAAEEARKLAAQIKKPVAVGFGIKTPNDVAVVASKAHGVVVGSAIVATIEQHGAGIEACRAKVESQVRALAAACRR